MLVSFGSARYAQVPYVPLQLGQVVAPLTEEEQAVLMACSVSASPCKWVECALTAAAPIASVRESLCRSNRPELQRLADAEIDKLLPIATNEFFNPAAKAVAVSCLCTGVGPGPGGGGGGGGGGGQGLGTGTLVGFGIAAAAVVGLAFFFGRRRR